MTLYDLHVSFGLYSVWKWTVFSFIASGCFSVGWPFSFALVELFSFDDLGLKSSPVLK